MAQARPVEPSNADYDALFTMTSTPTLEVDAAGNVLRGNPAACRLFELGPGELTDALLDDLLGADVTHAIGTTAPTQLEAQLPDGPETVLVRSQARALAGAHGGERFTVQLTRPAAAKDRADTLRGEVTSWSLMDDLSHNLGTPLSIVAGYSETLRDRCGEMEADDVRAAAEAIHRNTLRAIQELRALQARARVTAGGAGSLPSAVLLAWLRRILAIPLEANNAVLVGTATSTTITVDVGIVRQVLLNLCRAQLESGAPGGTVEVRIGTEDRGTQFRVTALTAPADGDPMLRATTALVAAAGGTYLPATATGEDHVVWLPDTSMAVSAQRPSIPIAVIEDDHDTAALIRASLANSSSMFDVVVDERTLARGLTAIADARPRIVLLDQHLPDGLGTDVLDRLDELAPGAIVVVLSRAPAHEPGTTDRVVWLEKSRVLADLGSELIGVLGAA